ncbi:enoyl-CoA hydratase/isomerase family protein [Bordetella hinzii]|jgi:enoyl-CoA hydratase/carnithine racemase|uniref:Enoyl-CoA hydratase n=2 Tax=Bordetella hinzii TaxID=103855 RepID=A0AAN1RUD8_9BORD|nr:enoyl-CoA hydratase/isomerase family protein [Bordetella hinzii]AKQ53952.1 2,3-dehydroadipyl-CoA hydratase [Bordetella hinzii]AKQ58442.1 2,3-dehydroadipyl-CoA hydratase [Bordetella hinzii]AZW16239.1 enoyl-CoA hydratase [Bordetella hinzii]KCB22463.1 enoyl-CoA hydratase/isomerase family protein [Bordetella hinzii OH87 BAL007II]KCB25901.1 enoyl-CoA hydratase/isomerase family protein [Bordetella hinzii L60]
MSEAAVKFEIDRGVALVTLNRPPVNALNRETRRRLVAIFDEISEREDIRCAVLTGSGTVFCAGADLKDRPAADIAGDFLEHNRITRETGNAIRECSKPVIAAVNGAALGAGLGLMAACDIMYASENATFGMPEINVGLAGGASMLRTLFGRSTLRRMFFTGQRLSAQELLRRNVLEDVLPADELLPTALALAHEIASKAPLAVVYAKRAANMVDLMPQRDAYRFEQDFTMALAKTEDAREARMAFLEKRQPQFKGR